MAFWHSSAHILGHSMELIYGGWLTIGPPVDDGFYYDMYTGPEACGKARSASEDDFKSLETKCGCHVLPPHAPQLLSARHRQPFSSPAPTLARYCWVRRIKAQIAKKGHSMTNRIEVTKDQALEVSVLRTCRNAVPVVLAW